MIKTGTIVSQETQKLIALQNIETVKIKKLTPKKKKK